MKPATIFGKKMIFLTTDIDAYATPSDQDISPGYQVNRMKEYILNPKKPFKSCEIGKK